MAARMLSCVAGHDVIDNHKIREARRQFAEAWEARNV